MKRVFDTYMLFFQVNQSAAALKHVFASLRLFVSKVRVSQAAAKLPCDSSKQSAETAPLNREGRRGCLCLDFVRC